jgi:hypothetical protein
LLRGETKPGPCGCLGKRVITMVIIDIIVVVGDRVVEKQKNEGGEDREEMGALSKERHVPSPAALAKTMFWWWATRAIRSSGANGLHDKTPVASLLRIYPEGVSR